MPGETANTAPALAGVFPPSARKNVVPPPSGRRVWPDWPGLWLVGEGHPAEFRTVRHGDARLVVVGQCLAGLDRLAGLLRRITETGRTEELGCLPGSYLAVLLRADSLTAVVDLAGQFPLYFRQSHGHIVIGSQARVTATMAALPVSPDRDALAAQIFCPDVPMLAGNRSALDGVRRLDGGQILHVDRRGEIQVRAAESLVPQESVTFADVAAGLRTALDTAVKARLDSGGQVTADLSGGLDSTSVAFLAARHTTGPLPVFTYHHPDAPADDLAYARRFGRLNSAFRPEVVLGDRNTLAFCDVRPGDRTDQPDPGATARARTHLRLSRIATAAGQGIHLCGEGADALLTPSPAYLVDLGRRGSKRELARHSYTWARTRQVSPMVVFARALRMSVVSISGGLRRLARVLEADERGSRDWTDAIGWWSPPGPELGWLTDRMRRRLAEECRAWAERPNLIGEGMGIADIAALHGVRTAGAVQRQLIENARRHGIWPQAPFLDNDVIRACSRLAAYRRADPPSVKPLLRAALSELVPDTVLSRITKGNYLREEFMGLRTGVTALVDLLADSRLAELGVISPGEVIRSVRRMASGSLAALPALNRLVSVELWLREWEEIPG